MFYANVVTPIFQENVSELALQKKIASLRRKVKFTQEKLNRTRQKNSDYQIEIFQIHRKLKNPMREMKHSQLEQLTQKVKTVETKIEDTQKLIEFYDKILKKLNFHEKPKIIKPETPKMTPRAISQLSRYGRLTPLERIKRTQRVLTSLKQQAAVKSGKKLPPLSLISDNKNTIKKLEEKFGTSNPTKIKDYMDNLRSMRSNLKRKIDLMVLIENAMERKINKMKQSGTKGYELKEKLRQEKLKVCETKLEILDAKDESDKIRSKVNELYEKITSEKPKDGTLATIRAIVDYAVAQYSQFSNQNEEEDDDSVLVNSVRFNPVPNLPLDIAYTPGTRSIRRMYSAMSTMRKYENSSNVDKEMAVFGMTLGHIFTERFATSFMPFKKHVSKQMKEEPEYPDPSPEVEEISTQSCKDIMERLFVEYSANTENLGMTLLTDSEIMQMDETFLSFMSSRDILISSLVDVFDIDECINFLEQKIEEDSTITCWIIRDFVQYTKLNEYISQVINIIQNVFQDDSKSFDSNIFNQMAWAALFSALFEATDDIPTRQQLFSMSHEVFTLELSQGVESQTNMLKTMVLFDLAQYLPNDFVQTATLQNQLTSFLLHFMSISNEYDTCFRVGVNFFCSCFSLLDEEEIMWHFAIFYHTLMKQLYQSEINEPIVVSCLKALQAVVESRHHYNKEQMHYLYLLPNVLAHLQLEAYPNGRVFRRKVTQTPQQNISMKDIPALSLESVIPALNFDNPKLQLHFQPKSEGIPEDAKKDEDTDENTYLEKRRCYPIYCSDNIHVHFVELAFSIIIDDKVHKFDVTYCDPFPHVNRKPNILFTIMKHMESKYNSYLVDDFSEEFNPPPSLGEPDSARVKDVVDFNLGAQSLAFFSNYTNTVDVADSPVEGQIVPILSLTGTKKVISHELPNILISLRENVIHHKGDYLRLLRLTMPSLFTPKKYGNGKHIASGAFGVVMMVPPKEETGGVPCAVKILEKSTNEFDNPHLFEVFTEVSILDLCRGDRRATQLVDFGCTLSSYYIVMEYYPKTLKAWRKSVADNPPLPTMLRVYREFLIAANILRDKKINHFDIKCDNIMLDVRGIPALADFGESMCYKNEKTCYTLLNKGTEWIKSPEMLSIDLTSTTANPNFDRRKKIGAGPASDIWSIGCLFFELLTGHFLFATTDWSFFYTRVTSEGPVCQPKDRQELLDLGCTNGEAFLEFVLKRNVRARPTLEQIQAKFDELFPEAKNSPLPEISLPSFE